MKLSNGEIYTGYTANMKTRLYYHQHGLVPHTSKYLPIKLISYVALEQKKMATRLENYFKNGSGFAFRNKYFID